MSTMGGAVFSRVVPKIRLIAACLLTGSRFGAAAAGNIGQLPSVKACNTQRYRPTGQPLHDAQMEAGHDGSGTEAGPRLGARAGAGLLSYQTHDNSPCLRLKPLSSTCSIGSCWQV